MSESLKELKIMIIGSSGAGKTSFVQRWTKGNFIEDYRPTIISDFGFKIYENNKNLFRVQLWDIGGQDKSASMAKIFARDSHGCIVVTDISINENPTEIFKWKEIISEESSFIDDEKIPFILIGNKIDLIKTEENKKIIEEKTKNICNNYGFMNYFLTSAKEGINVNESMQYLLDHIIERFEKFCEDNNQEFGQKRKDTLKLDNEKHKNRKMESDCCRK